MLPEHARPTRNSASRRDGTNGQLRAIGGDWQRAPRSGFPSAATSPSASSPRILPNTRQRRCSTARRAYGAKNNALLAAIRPACARSVPGAGSACALRQTPVTQPALLMVQQRSTVCALLHKPCFVPGAAATRVGTQPFTQMNGRNAGRERAESAGADHCIFDHFTTCSPLCFSVRAYSNPPKCGVSAASKSTTSQTSPLSTARA
jgi:hypothetical protein